MAVSFVVPARNEERYIRDCVDSLRGQDACFSCEIVVVDNGSTDATAAVASEFGARVVREPKVGLANARLAGLAAATGEILIYVDADTRLPEMWSREVVGLFDADPHLVAVSCGFTFYDGRRLDNIGNAVFRFLINRILSHVLRKAGRPGVLIGSAFAVRAGALRNVNGFNAAFQFYGEDTSLARELHALGDVRFVESLLVQTSARRYQQQGLLRVVYKYFVIFALIQLGMLDAAAKLARRLYDAG